MTRSIKLSALILALLFVFKGECHAFSLKAPAAGDKVARGVWVTVFSEKKVLYSKEAADRLIDFCARSRIQDIYLQVYRANMAYYDSRVADRSKYEAMIAAAGRDTIDYLISKGSEKGVAVHAWINVLSLGGNKDAGLVKKHGKDILTRDQHMRVSMKGEETDASDKYYLRDTQLFLEPGDPRVAEFSIAIAEEIAKRYPGLAGIHLDYIRYPYPVPIIPGSRFNDFGLSYGYGKENVAAFKTATGLDPFRLSGNDQFLKWDNWKRGRVTRLVEAMARAVRSARPGIRISAAVIPSLNQAYMAAYQDWTAWLKSGAVDHVVLMNYTKDDDWAVIATKAALSFRGKGKVMAGLGAFLMKKEEPLFMGQYEKVLGLAPDGIVFFSYDDIAD